MREADDGAARAFHLVGEERERRRAQVLDAEDRRVEVLVERHRHGGERLARVLDAWVPPGDHVGVRDHQVLADHDARALDDGRTPAR